ncbi:MAG: hypothetical protein ACSHXF_04175 [Aquaticitalea sp.]
MNTLINQQYTPALGGFFSWLGRTIRNVAHAISEVSHNPFFIINIIEDAFDGNGFTVGYDNGPQGPVVPMDSTLSLFRNLPSQEINLTSLDEMKLDAWVNGKFLPLFKTYFSTIKDFNLNGVTRNEFINHYNDAQEFISLLSWYQDYVLTQLLTDFSREAIMARNQFLTIQINLLQLEVEEYKLSTGVTSAPQRKTVTFPTNKYAGLDLGLPNSVTTTKLELESENNGSGSQTLPSVVTQSNTNGTNSNSKSSGVGLVFWSLLAIGLYHLSKSNNEKLDAGDKPKVKK